MSFMRSTAPKFPATWTVKSFDEAIDDATGGNAKVQTGEYRDHGKLPVIDQGQAPIAGYVDDVSLACKAPLPCILFGDHTRTVKYAQVPFALGADGVKVLVPRHPLVPRFIYHYLRSVRLPDDLGYSRHFKYLREAPIPVPLPVEQRRIADILDRADAVRRKRKETIAITEELLRSTFSEMFGDPVTNPKGWPVKPLTTLSTVTTGNTPSRDVPEYFGDAIEWIKSDNINTPSHYLTPAIEGLSEKGRAVARVAPAGSTLMTCIAGSPDCIGNVGLADRQVAFNQQINAVTPNAGVDHRWLYVLLWLGKRLVQGASTNSMKGMVSKGKLEQVLWPVPPREQQKEFGALFDAALTLNRRQEAAAGESDVLFGSLAQRAFRGELTTA